MIPEQVLEFIIMASTICIGSTISSLILHFGLIKHQVPRMRNLKMGLVVFIYWLFYILIVSVLFAVPVAALTYKKLVTPRMLVAIVGVFSFVHIFGLGIYAYTYIKNLKELKPYNNKLLNTYNNLGSRALDGTCNGSDDNTSKDAADFTCQDLLFNHRVFLVYNIIIILLFVTCFAFFELIRNL